MFPRSYDSKNMSSLRHFSKNLNTDHSRLQVSCMDDLITLGREVNVNIENVFVSKGRL